MWRKFPVNEFDAKAGTWDEDPQKVARAKSVAQAIRRAVPLHVEMRALEYGCGTGLLSFALGPYLGPITLADSSSGMLAALEEKIAAAGGEQMRSLKLDLAVDPLPDQRFHFLYNLMTLHHIPDTPGVLRDFFALLEPGGFLCIADLDEEDGSFHGPDAQVHPGFNRGLLTSQLVDAGFERIELRTCFEIFRDGRTYPVFLASAKKPNQ